VGRREEKVGSRKRGGDNGRERRRVFAGSIFSFDLTRKVPVWQQTGTFFSTSNFPFSTF
jgi:hypothetical protein